MMSKNKISLCVFGLISGFLPWMSGAGAEVKIQELDRMFSNTTHSDYHVQLMMLSVNTFIDPPPNIDNFENFARAIVNISSHACYPELRKLIDGLKKAELKKYLGKGYPRWVWRIKTPSGYHSLAIMVDVDNNFLSIGGQWYVATPEMMDLVVYQFIRNLNGMIKPIEERARGVTPEWQEAMRKAAEKP